MKKTLFVFALAAVLVLSFSTVAMAKYAGYAYNTNGGGAVGYLSWAGAKALMTLNGVDASLQNTPHGGYTANTTKCAVCHSAHRAASDATVAGVASYWKLTPGAQACTACHTAWGANPIPTALVEWGNPADGGGGPHNSFNCLNACHAGIHGGTTSVYGAVNEYNLTNRNDAAIAAAFAAGNSSDATGTGAGGSNKGTGTYGDVDATTFGAGYSVLDLTVSANRQTAGALRAMATGYTCGASGCHSSSQFAVNKHGYAELRAGNPGASTTLDTFMTGHITNTPSGCSPCHTVPDLPSGAFDNKCATCHDMRGKATNSSAFPHGNRNITVYEKTDGGTWTLPNPSVEETIVVSGNLWMYKGDATYRDGSGVPTTTVTYTGLSARSVIRDAVGFHDGHIGDIRDGVCLKCHGYKYWPTHGMQIAPGGHGGSAALNFSTK